MSAPDEPARPARVLIVEDHPIVAAGLASLLEDYPDITITGVASSVTEVIPAIEKAAPDVVVIDYHLPDGTGGDVADRVRSRWPSAALIIISADAGSEPLLAATDLGAAGSLIKSAAGEEIVRTIRAVAAGETVIPAGVMTRALALYREGARQRAHQALLDSLTPRERQVLTLMADGADNRTVAERLHISYATVRTHVRSILAKLGTRSQLEAVAKAAEWGFRR